MKITFISPPANLSGGQRVVAIYADQLLKRGHDVTVVARRAVMPTCKEKLLKLVRRQRVPVRPQETHFDRMKAPLFVPDHSGPIVAEDVPDGDIVIATWWETAFEIVHFPPSKGCKIYFVQHHEVHPHLPKHISGASYLLPLKKITISSWLVDTMRDLYGDKDVALVPNSVEHELFFAPERGRRPVPTVGLMYSTSHFKGVDVALRAIEIARRTYPHLRVVAFGTERPTSDLPLPVGAEFHLLPHQDVLREIYAACDVFLAASRSEGFGLPLLEAMACRTPVVATLTGCAGDIITNGQNGYYVAVEDAEALGQRLIDLLATDDQSWRAMSAAAYERSLVYAWHDSARMLEKHLSKYANIIKKS